MKNVTKTFNKIYCVILAAGEGKRMKSSSRNKVTHEVQGVPLISRTLQNLHKVGVKNIIVVVGFAKESVQKLLKNDIKTVEQTERLGTGHALSIAFEKIPKKADLVMVLNGDDSYAYTPDTYQKIFETYYSLKPSVLFLTIMHKNPEGIGRIVRNKKGTVLKIVEEKNATEEEKKISEINVGCYVFSVKFLQKYIQEIKKNPITGEYYITSLIDIAVKHKEKLETLQLREFKWRGVNTQNQLQEAHSVINYE